MVSRLLFVASFIFLFENFALAQEGPKQISLGVEAYLLIGGETNASFDFLTGLRGNYIFQQTGDIDFFSSIGLATDIFNPDSRLMLADAQVGLYWQKQKRLSVFASAGLNYLQESHSLLLNDGIRTWQKSAFGLLGHIGFNLRLSESLSSAVFVKQINSTFTSIGMGFTYAF
ncbi:MAG: hypothetical protein KTR30_37690 [Saprospiraceae bacterium]|nr:hypothetical protein [Saprospiraceae bacterium]